MAQLFRLEGMACQGKAEKSKERRRRSGASLMLVSVFFLSPSVSGLNTDGDLPYLSA